MLRIQIRPDPNQYAGSELIIWIWIRSIPVPNYFAGSELILALESDPDPTLSFTESCQQKIKDGPKQCFFSVYFFLIHKLIRYQV